MGVAFKIIGVMGESFLRSSVMSKIWKYLVLMSGMAMSGCLWIHS